MRFPFSEERRLFLRAGRLWTEVGSGVPPDTGRIAPIARRARRRRRERQFAGRPATQDKSGIQRKTPRLPCTGAVVFAFGAGGASPRVLRGAGSDVPGRPGTELAAPVQRGSWSALGKRVRLPSIRHDDRMRPFPIRPLNRRTEQRTGDRPVSLGLCGFRPSHRPRRFRRTGWRTSPATSAVWSRPRGRYPTIAMGLS